MKSFEATACASGLVRIDMIDDLDDGMASRFSTILSLHDARCVALVLNDAIEKSEVLEAKSANRRKKK